MKDNIVKTTIFCSTPQKIFIFLDIFAGIKFLISELSHRIITQKLIKEETVKVAKERPYKNVLIWKI